MTLNGPSRGLFCLRHQAGRNTLNEIDEAVELTEQIAA